MQTLGFVSPITHWSVVAVDTDDDPRALQQAPGSAAAKAPPLSGVEVRRAGRVEPFLNADPRLSSATAPLPGFAIADYSVPPIVIPRHEHVENFLHVIVEGLVSYEVHTGGKVFTCCAGPGTTFILPRGTVDELRWRGATHRIAAAIHPSLLVSALEETAHEVEIELCEHWNVTDRNILSVMLAMTTDLEEGSPAGPLYGESLANSLAVYLLKRYAVKRYVPAIYKGGLPRYRLNRVLEYIDANLCGSLHLSHLAAAAGMSPHYFSELFKQSTGTSPHRYVLSRRIDLAKERLRDSRCSVTEAALSAGFCDQSHFSRTFRRWVGVSPARFRSDR